MEDKKRGINKKIHFITFIGIIILVIPASINPLYIPIVLLLMGINLSNSLITKVKGNKIVLLALLSLMPVLIYAFLKYVY